MEKILDLQEVCFRSVFCFIFLALFSQEIKVEFAFFNFSKLYRSTFSVNVLRRILSIIEHTKA